MKQYFSSIPEAIKHIQKGKMLILVDSSSRENEGDFSIPSSVVTPEHLLTMIRSGGGLICCAITKGQAYRLSLPLMVSGVENTEKTKVNFTVSVNARRGITTGVSMYDRLRTIKTLADSTSSPFDLVRPGHLFGLVAKSGGVLERSGHTEAAVDLARLAGFRPSGVLCEIVGKNGKMAKLPELISLSTKHHMPIVRIRDLIAYIRKHPLPELPRIASIVKTAAAQLPTVYGRFHLSIYTSLLDQREHAILTLGKLKKPVLTRIHSQCLTGDTLLSLKCDCREQLHKSMQLISQHGSGIILYLNQEGRGIGLSNKIKAYALQEKGLDTLEADHALGFPGDSRDYGVVCEILHDFNISEISLLTNNPDKKKQLTASGIRVTDRIPLEVSPNALNKHYLFVKKQKLGHHLTVV